MFKSFLFSGISVVFLIITLSVPEARAAGTCTFTEDTIICAGQETFERFAKVLLKEQEFPTGAIEYMVGNGAGCETYAKGEKIGYIETKPCTLERPDGATVEVDCAVVSTKEVGRKTEYNKDYWVFKKHVTCR